LLVKPAGGARAEQKILVDEFHRAN
jgi:hypothetical protein